jgi:hypothetical protein
MRHSPGWSPNLREAQTQLAQAAASEEILSSKDPANGRLVEDLSVMHLIMPSN